MHVVKHGTDALTSGVLQSEQSCTHVETHEATLLERFQHALPRIGGDPIGQSDKQGPMFAFLQFLRAGFFRDHAARPMHAGSVENSEDKP